MCSRSRKIAGPRFVFIAADAFENRGAVTHHVRKDVQLGVVPIDPLSVVPDFLGRLNRIDAPYWIVSLAVVQRESQNTVRGDKASMHQA